MLIEILIAAGLTCFIETILISLIMKQEKLQNLKLNTILINLITNLTLNLSLVILSWLQVTPFCINGFTIIAEFIIPIAEYFMFSYCYPQIKKKKLFLTSLILNVITFIIGLIIF